MIPNITPVNTEHKEQLQLKIDQKTKPVGALGKLEAITLKIGLIQSTDSPELKNPQIYVFAADHGVATAGVSAYPQEVTAQMVSNFLNKGAAINVFCTQHNIDLKVIDAGVAADFEPNEKLIDLKVAYGTKSFIFEPAMTKEECERAFNHGIELLGKSSRESNIVGFGEMGIGNTSSTSMLMSVFCNLPIRDCVGRGTGLNDELLEKKITVLTDTISNHAIDPESAFEVLQTFGGFEIVMMAGAMLSAASQKKIIMVDGFIASAAILAASRLNEHVLDYAIFCHQSDENGHKKMLSHMQVEALLHLNLRLGEGTGCALAYPIIESAVVFLNKMASFESASVSNKL